MRAMQRSDFHYDLPTELIAQQPPAVRSGGRLLHVQSRSLTDMHIAQLVDLIQPADLMVFNNTRVIPARLYGHKASGGRVEIMIERLLDAGRALALIRASKTPRPGSRITLDGDQTDIEVLQRQGEFFLLRFDTDDLIGLLDRQGHIPLPPYIEREDELTDRERYQTVFSKSLGAVAAPTAGLHFDETLLKSLNDKGVRRAEVTLHVGAGTFQPVRVDDLSQHQMHYERVEVSQAVCDQISQTRSAGGRVIAVGTTVVRSLESAADETGTVQPFDGETNLFITPGYRFRVIDALFTNFHLPESTLLMLVSAFAGKDRIMQAYQHAIEQRYRFFSYGDAMFLDGFSA